MWVCVCHGIRCRDIKDAAGNGASRAGDVFRQFEVRPRCGKCVPMICGMLEESRSANEDAPPAPVRCCGEG